MLARCKAGALERWYAGVLDSQRTVRLAIWGAGMLGHWHTGISVVLCAQKQVRWNHG